MPQRKRTRQTPTFRGPRWQSLLALTAAALLSWSALVGGTRAAQAQGFGQTEPSELKPILNLLPNRAQMAVIVPNPQAFSGHLAEINDELGLRVPELANALGEFKRRLGIGAGFKDDGPLLIVVQNLNLDDPVEPAEAMLLTPVSNYGQFVRAFQGNPNEVITRLQLPQGFSGFARQTDSHAVLSGSRSLVGNYQPANRADQWIDMLGDQGQTALDELDLVVLVNVQRMAPELRSLLDQAGAGIGQVTAGAPALSQITQALPQGLADTWKSAMRTLIDQTSGMMVGLGLSEEGIRGSLAAKFTPGSELAQALQSADEALPLMKRLPNQEIVTASAINFQGIDTGKLLGWLESSLPAGARNDPAVQMLQMSMPLLQQVQGWGSAYYAPGPNARLGGPIFNGLNVLRVQNASQYIADYRRYINALGEAALPLGQGQDQFNQLRFTTSYIEGHLQIDGIKVDRYQTSYALPPSLMQQFGWVAPLATMLSGPQSGYILGKDNYVLVTTAEDPTLLRRAVNNLRDPAGLQERALIQQARERGLPPRSMFEGYLNVGGVVQSVNAAMRLLAPQLSLEVPANLPPITSGASLENGALLFKSQVPIEVVLYLSELGQQVQGMIPSQTLPTLPR